jgi:hypothetical protein
MDSESDHVLGERDETLHLESVEQIRQAVIELASQAQRQLIVFAPIPDPLLFNRAELADHLANLATGHARNRARFLIEDTDRFLADNGRVVDVCRRLSSFIQARRPGKDYSHIPEMFLVADNTGYLHRPQLDQRTHLANFNAPRKAKALSHRFNEMWERSEPIPGLHVLGL